VRHYLDSVRFAWIGSTRLVHRTHRTQNSSTTAQENIYQARCAMPPKGLRASSWIVPELHEAAVADGKTKTFHFQEFVHSLGGQHAKTMLGMTPEVDTSAFKADVLALRARLRAQTFMLFHPKGVFIQYWDMITGMALMYTLFITPFEVGLDLPTKLDGLFICNQICALIFLSDICVQFFLPVPDPNMGEGAYERRHRALGLRYFKGWFLLDVITIIPFDGESPPTLLRASVSLILCHICIVLLMRTQCLSFWTW
jgi:hypothetical protein